jgi:hypothetical protein
MANRSKDNKHAEEMARIQKEREAVQAATAAVRAARAARSRRRNDNDAVVTVSGPGASTTFFRAFFGG